MSLVLVNVIGFASFNAILGTRGVTLVLCSFTWCLGAYVILRRA